MNKYEYENQQRAEYFKKHPLALAMTMGFSGFILFFIGILTLPILIGFIILPIAVLMFIGGVISFYGILAKRFFGKVHSVGFKSLGELQKERGKK